jgi:hypothetical protein
VRRGAVAVLVVLLGTASAGSAAAHNGVGAAFKGRAGPYVVYAYDGYQNAPGTLEYRLAVIDAATGEPAADVRRVTFSAVPLRQSGTTVPTRDAQVYNNVVFYELPNPYPGDWTVTTTLTGPAGRGRVSFAMHGQPPITDASPSPSYALPPAGGGGGTTAWVIAAGAVAGVVAAVGVAWAVLRRRRGRVRPAGG